MTVVEKLLYSLNAAKSQFPMLHSLDIYDFSIIKRDNKISISVKPIYIDFILDLKTLEKNGDRAYFTKLVQWCNELEKRWDDLTINDKEHVDDNNQ